MKNKIKIKMRFKPFLAMVLIVVTVFLCGGWTTRPTTARADDEVTWVQMDSIFPTFTKINEQIHLTFDLPITYVFTHLGMTADCFADSLFLSLDGGKLQGGASYSIDLPSGFDGNLTIPILDCFPKITDEKHTLSVSARYLATTLSVSGTLYTNDHDFLYGNIVPLPPDPVQEGHTFVGWYLDEALTQPYNGQPITEDTDLFAKFEINRYTIVIDRADGSEKESRTVDWGTVLNLEPITFTGHTFLGWFISDDTAYTGGAITEDMTITAKWKRETFTVTFKLPDGSVYTTVHVLYGQSLVEIMAANELTYFNIQSVSGTNGETIKDLTTIIGDTAVTIAEQFGADKALTFLQKNWPYFAIGGGAVFFLCIVGGLIAAKKKRRK